MSLPLRKCGLKFQYITVDQSEELVTSLAEVWIEILHLFGYCQTLSVTSLAEVWIEINEGTLKIYWPCRHFPCGSVD